MRITIVILIYDIKKILKTKFYWNIFDKSFTIHFYMEYLTQNVRINLHGIKIRIMQLCVPCSLDGIINTLSAIIIILIKMHSALFMIIQLKYECIL